MQQINISYNELFSSIKQLPYNEQVILVKYIQNKIPGRKFIYNSELQEVPQENNYVKKLNKRIKKYKVPTFNIGLKQSFQRNKLYEEYLSDRYWYSNLFKWY